ncbi:MAG: hypothetical protein CMB73_07780 [Euryarchaeota archaeon]|nr:hypothetical protein [Euryarchaeota archaeon]
MSRQVWCDQFENAIHDGICSSTKRQREASSSTKAEGSPPSARVQKMKQWANRGERCENKHSSESVRTSTSKKAPSTGPAQVEWRRISNIGDTNSSSAVVSINFHHSKNLAVSVNSNSCVRVFSVKEDKSELLQKLALGGLIRNTEFSKHGDNIVMCGKGSLVFGDIESGVIERVACPLDMHVDGDFAQSQDGELLGILGAGELNLVSCKSRTRVMKINSSSSIQACLFPNTGREVIGVTDDGWLCSWDLRTQRCVQTAQNFDDVKSICTSSDGKKLITGLGNGLVNVYDGSKTFTGDTRKSNPQPLRCFSSLTNTVSSININPQADLAVVASSMKRNALRVIHLPSLSMLDTWPTSSTPLHHVTSTAFSPAGDRLAIANARGCILTYRISYLS